MCSLYGNEWVGWIGVRVSCGWIVYSSFRHAKMRMLGEVGV